MTPFVTRFRVPTFYFFYTEDSSSLGIGNTRQGREIELPIAKEVDINKKEEKGTIQHKKVLYTIISEVH